MDRCVYAPFPKYEDRQQLFKHMNQNYQNVLEEKDLEYLANATERHK